jgi:hypothetical protein
MIVKGAVWVIEPLCPARQPCLRVYVSSVQHPAWFARPRAGPDAVQAGMRDFGSVPGASSVPAVPQESLFVHTFREAEFIAVNSSFMVDPGNHVSIPK